MPRRNSRVPESASEKEAELVFQIRRNTKLAAAVCRAASSFFYLNAASRHKSAAPDRPGSEDCLQRQVPKKNAGSFLLKSPFVY